MRTFFKFYSFVFLVLAIILQPVVAYNSLFGSSWYVYLIVLFMVIGISSCIGACIRHRRQQLYMQQIRQQAAIINSPGNVNTGFANGPTAGVYGGYPPFNPQGAAHPINMEPPSYSEAYDPTKDPNMPPAYDEAVSSPSYPASPGPPYNMPTYSAPSYTTPSSPDAPPSTYTISAVPQPDNGTTTASAQGHH